MPTKWRRALERQLQGGSPALGIHDQPSRNNGGIHCSPTENNDVCQKVSLHHLIPWAPLDKSHD